MDFFELLSSRNTAAKLTDPAPSREEIQRILEAAIRAPDHGRLSPWRFTIVQGEARERLGQAMAARLLLDQPESTADELDRQRRKAFRAPLIIVVRAHLTDAGAKVPAVEQLLAAGAATENLLLAVRAIGYDAAWKTGAAAYDTGVKRALAIPEDEAIIGLIYIGTLVAPGTPREISLDGLVDWL